MRIYICARMDPGRRRDRACLAAGAAAQEGHPLAGTWYGDFPTGNQKTDLTVIMKWDGRASPA